VAAADGGNHHAREERKRSKETIANIAAQFGFAERVNQCGTERRLRVGLRIGPSGEPSQRLEGGTFCKKKALAQVSGGICRPPEIAWRQVGVGRGAVAVSSNDSTAKGLTNAGKPLRRIALVVFPRIFSERSGRGEGKPKGQKKPGGIHRPFPRFPTYPAKSLSDRRGGKGNFSDAEGRVAL